MKVKEVKGEYVIVGWGLVVVGGKYWKDEGDGLLCQWRLCKEEGMGMSGVLEVEGMKRRVVEENKCVEVVGGE
ncbi:hypothetical protein, partial [Paenibacillus xylanexedens]|uniref:hypothetical protein n=1 Tax=Paenibacillus xylanexedens TaxID=528191 RepID=UPI0011A7B1E5